MKRLAFLVAMLLMLTFAFACHAEDDAEITVLGTGGKSVVVVVVAGEDDERLFEVLTDKQTLLDALTEVKLLEAELVSWGYNVVTVNDIKADYDNKGQYWSIFLFDETEENFVPMDTAIDKTDIIDGMAVGFLLNE